MQSLTSQYQSNFITLIVLPSLIFIVRDRIADPAVDAIFWRDFDDKAMAKVNRIVS